MNDNIDTGRRRMAGALCAGALTALGSSRVLAAPDPDPDPIPYHGGRIYPPVSVPALPVQLSDGSRTDLATLLRGHATAMHLMFTGCSTTCPIQGIVFHRVQGLLRDPLKRGIQLVSLSIDPLEDSPEAMRAWLSKFQAGPGWIAARPMPEGLDTIQRLFGVSNGGGALADHATAVSIVNQRASLVWRTYELPSPETLADMLNQA